jgi:hypothetical protein
MSTPSPQSGDQPILVVRYNRVLGIVSVVVGVLMLALGVATSDLLNIVLGAVLGAVGLSYVLGKAVVLTAHELQLKSPLGFTTKRVPVTGPRDLRLDGRTLLHTADGRKIVTLGFGIDQGDVELLRSLVGGAGSA